MNIYSSTFHSVYISTRPKQQAMCDQYDLHSTLFILVPGRQVILVESDIHLHSTLFILVRLGGENMQEFTNIYIPLCLY